MRKTSALFIFLIIFGQTLTLSAQDTLSGDWEGAINIQGTKLTIITHFYTAEHELKGTIDIPQQGGQDIPLQNVSISPQDSVQFEFMAGPGLAQFEGFFKNDSTITGTFHQGGMQFPFKLTRTEVTTEIPQEEKIPVPYDRKELIIQNDSIDIAGTLTQPENQQTKQLVIFISGSGAQNRDEEIMGFKPFALLADSLTRSGIATFRYDDRGIGESTGNFSRATLDILASDVKAIVSNLSSAPYNFNTITLLGHSQGGIIASKVAAEDESIDKIILMASTGVPIKKVLRFQVKQAFTGSGVDSVLIEKEISAREQLMKAVRDQQDIQQAQNRYQKYYKDIQIAAGVDSAQAQTMADRQANQLVKTFGSPQIQSLLFYDPVNDLRKVDIPALVLWGGKDTQVNIHLNRPPIEEALEKAGIKYEMVTFKDANHLFQNAKTGSVQEYGSLKKEFVDSFTSTISNWIKKE